MNINDWRKEIKGRDNWKCCVCGAKERLEAHHIIPKHERPDLSLNTINGITLCHKCHRIAHLGSYSGDKRHHIMTNPEWFSEENVLVVNSVINGFIQRAIDETIARDNNID